MLLAFQMRIEGKKALITGVLILAYSTKPGSSESRDQTDLESQESCTPHCCDILTESSISFVIYVLNDDGNAKNSRITSSIKRNSDCMEKHSLICYQKISSDFVPL